ncbi:MAG: hypothetical protein PHC49_10690 [Desulfuromonadaceae bacterium]|nr:hypothetical protein [Desulfuromonadaceae bacterium]
MKKHPKYNVLSCRVSDDTKHSISHALGGCSVQQFIHSAIEEKLAKNRLAYIARAIRGNR